MLKPGLIVAFTCLVASSCSFFSGGADSSSSTVSPDTSEPSNNQASSDVLTSIPELGRSGDLYSTAPILETGDTCYLYVPGVVSSTLTYDIVYGNDVITVSRMGRVTALREGSFSVEARDSSSNVVGSITMEVVGIDDNPYYGMSETEFYLDYEEAISSTDAYFRSRLGFMSGSLEVPDAELVRSSYRPSEDGMYIRNSALSFSEDRLAYYVVDAIGEVVDVVYRGGAYITLEEVSAYVYAYREIPANYVESNSMEPYESEFGEYLRLNHSEFSGNTSRYPYEPELPDINGCGGSLQYYEMDVGTTGTYTDPDRYPPTLYNDGSSITRGAARIVYARLQGDGSIVDDVEDMYLFYTNNHYNDFSEYLNYQGGWGETFGNVTGGGSLDDRNDPNPTPYVETLLRDITVG